MSTVNIFKAKGNNCFKLTVIVLSLIRLIEYKTKVGAASMAKEAVFFISVFFFFYHDSFDAWKCFSPVWAVQ